MIWKATIPGQPVSVNHLYIPVWRKDKRNRPYKGRAYSPEGKKYYEDAITILRVAKPSRWQPAGQVRVVYDLYLQHEMDADNVLKLLSDAIEGATGVNDKRMLPCVRSSQMSSPSRARVEIEVYDPPGELRILSTLPWPLPPVSQLPPTPSGSSSTTSPRAPKSSSDVG